MPVMSMGGFNGSDDAPTLAFLQASIASGQLRFVLVGRPGGGAVRRLGTEISRWVSSTCSVVDVGSSSGGTLYDCAASGGV